MPLRKEQGWHVRSRQALSRSPDRSGRGGADCLPMKRKGSNSYRGKRFLSNADTRDTLIDMVGEENPG